MNQCFATWKRIHHERNHKSGPSYIMFLVHDPGKMFSKQVLCTRAFRLRALWNVLGTPSFRFKSAHISVCAVCIWKSHAHLLCARVALPVKRVKQVLKTTSCDWITSLCKSVESFSKPTRTAFKYLKCLLQDNTKLTSLCWEERVALLSWKNSVFRLVYDEFAVLPFFGVGSLNQLTGLLHPNVILIFNSHGLRKLIILAFCSYKN